MINKEYLMEIDLTQQNQGIAISGTSISYQEITGTTFLTGPTGPAGANGAQGPAGNDGAPGVGVPTSGTTGQVLAKNSSTNYDTAWTTLTKSSVGLGNVDNTSDANKPISTATQTALNGKENSFSKGSLIAGTNVTLSGTIANRLVGSGDITISATGGGGSAGVSSVNTRTGDVTLTKSDVGLANVDNTSDANKPVSTAQQTALNGKEPTVTAGTTSQYYRGDKTFQTLDKTAVGLANVDNTADVDKPISTATQTALNTKVSQSTDTGTNLVYTRLTGTEGTTPVSMAASANTIARRTASGQLTVTDATVAGNATTKGQVDTALALKQDNITLTTTGTSGPATLTGATLNIPQYSGGGGGGGIVRQILQINAATTGATTASTDYIYYWSGSTAYTFTLPSVTSNSNLYTLKNNSTITQTVANSTDISSIRPGDAYEFFSDGTNWRAI